jgi:membrane protein
MAVRRAQIRDRLTRILRVGTRAIETALRVLEGESVRLRAMALTYISLFALVPALVVAFSVVQAFTGMDRIARLVHEFLLENLAVGARTTIQPYLDRFVGNAHATSAGLVGGALLIWSAVNLFSNVERAINDVWGIKRRRPLAQQAVIYWVGLTLGPVLLAGSVALTAAARSWLAGGRVTFLAAAASVLLTCAFFAVLYLIVPITKVRIDAAAFGGLVAGIAWEIAKWGYTFAVGRFFRYHAVYGSVAAVPIFLLWLFVSWTILLFGARLAYVIQYAPALLAGPSLAASKTGREILAGQAMLEVALAYDRGGPTPDSQEIVTRLRAVAEDAGEALGALRTGGLVMALTDGGLVPSRPLEQITLFDVRRAVAGAAPAAGAEGEQAIVAQIVKAIEDQASERLSDVTFRALCDRVRARPGAVAHAEVVATAGAGGDTATPA